MSDHGDCSKALTSLYEFLDHEMTDVDADLIRAHLDACEPCLDAFAVEEALRAVVRRSCAEHAPETLRWRVSQITTTVIVRRSL
ncbi:MAG: mycothiol system anti-sigma-R factor [Micropruina sp.]|nr:mycothiol system anti-sigma-R factor [Micropruina sp.]